MVAGRAGAVSRRVGSASVGRGGKSLASASLRSGAGRLGRTAESARRGSCRRESLSASARRTGSFCESGVGSGGSRSGSWTSTRSVRTCVRAVCTASWRACVLGGREGFAGGTGVDATGGGSSILTDGTGGGVSGGAGHSCSCTSTSAGGRRSSVGIEKGGPHITMKAWMSRESTRPMARFAKVRSRITAIPPWCQVLSAPWRWQGAPRQHPWRCPSPRPPVRAAPPYRP
jgi:hypothetical protein